MSSARGVYTTTKGKANILCLLLPYRARESYYEKEKKICFFFFPTKLDRFTIHKLSIVLAISGRHLKTNHPTPTVPLVTHCSWTRSNLTKFFGNRCETGSRKQKFTTRKKRRYNSNNNNNNNNNSILSIDLRTFFSRLKYFWFYEQVFIFQYWFMSLLLQTVPRT